MVRKRKNSTVRVGGGYSVVQYWRACSEGDAVTSHRLMTCGYGYPSRWRDVDRCLGGDSDGLY